MKKTNFIRLVTIYTILVLLLPTFSFANGLNLNGLGSRAMSMGGAYVGLANDYSAVYWNPAGLTQIQGTSISIFAIDVIPMATYKYSPYGVDAATINNNYFSGATGIFFDAGFIPNLKIGLYGAVPSGLGAKWDDVELRAFSGGAGTVYKWMSKIGVFHFGPALAYQVNDKLSVGATVNISYGMMDMDRPVDMLSGMAPGNDGIVDTQYDESSDGMGFGFTFGVLYKASDKVSMGVTMKTKNTVAFSGTANNPTFGLMGASTKSDFDRDITWPIWIAGGVAVNPIPKLTLTADAQWTQWSATQDVLITEYEDAAWKGAMEPVGAHKMNLQWEDRVQIRFGAEYLISELIALRAGYYNDPAPAPDETTNILMPSITNNVITFGIGFAKGPLGLDVSFEYQFGTEREINPFPSAPNLPQNMPGMHGMDTIIPTLALTYNL